VDHLITELRNPSSNDLDLLTPSELVLLMCKEDALVPSAIAGQAETIGKVIELTIKNIRAGGRLIYCGAGTSGRLGVLDASECPPTFNVPKGLVIGIIAGGEKALTSAIEGAEDNPQAGRKDLEDLSLNKLDTVVGIASSGRTPYVMGALQYAKEVGSLTVAFSCNPDAEINQAASLCINVITGPEILTGSTRLKAGTATKLVLNMISTGVMVGLGKTFGNLMVDLKATNVKLKARANRIVRQFTLLNEKEAAHFLEICEGEVKTALVVHQCRIEPEIARIHLEENEGIVRKTIATFVKPSQKVLELDPELILGVDGGASKTVAILGRLGKKDFTILGRGEAGASNPRAVGFSAASLAIEVAVGLAFTQAKVPFSKVGVLVAGVAGAGRDEEKSKMELALKKLANTVFITSDAALILEEGLLEGWGIAVISGTGSMVLGKDKQGNLIRSGGWGNILGDEGSGFSVGMEALKLLTRIADGRAEDSILKDIILKHLKINNIEEIVGLLAENKLSKKVIASIAPLVLQAHCTGETQATTLLSKEAELLADCVNAVYIQMKLQGESVPLTLAGGMIRQSMEFRELFLNRLESKGIKLAMLTIVHEPGLGGLRLASQKL